jgi:hypothetical protein
MSAWIPALHAGMTHLRGLCFKLDETGLVIFSKERTNDTKKNFRAKHAPDRHPTRIPAFAGVTDPGNAKSAKKNENF